MLMPGVIPGKAPEAYIYLHQFERPLTPSAPQSLFTLNHFLCLILVVPNVDRVALAQPVLATIVNGHENLNEQVEVVPILKPKYVQTKIQTVVVPKASGCTLTPSDAGGKSINTKASKREMKEEDRLHIARWAKVHRPSESNRKRPSFASRYYYRAAPTSRAALHGSQLRRL